MKSIKVSELKANLSRYLRMAARGTPIVVTDRDDPIAQLGPAPRTPTSIRARLAAEGRLKLGSQDWGKLSISALRKRIDIQAELAAVREDPHEVP